MRRLVTFLAVFALLGVAGSAAANPIVAGPVISQAGLRVECNPLLVAPGDCLATTVGIERHSAWMNPAVDLTSGAAWISYNLTGYDQAVLAQRSDTQAIMRVIAPIETQLDSSLTMRVWADDTAKVWLHNTAGGADVLLFDHTIWAQSTCETYPISCQTSKYGQFTYGDFAVGGYELWFDTYQIGTGTDTISNPFGVAFEGVLTPEPGSMLLLGTGLIGLGGAVRRRLRK